MLGGGAFEGHAVLAALADQPGEVDRGVYADGGEAGGVVYFRGELVGRDFLELDGVSR